MRIRLSEERKQSLIDSLSDFFTKEFDEKLSPYRAEKILDLFIHELGPVAYNQAIQDARGFMLAKLEDLDTEFYFPEEST